MKTLVGAPYARPLLALALAAVLFGSGCTQKAAPVDGYRPGVLPGIRQGEVTRLLGNPSQREPFALRGINADVFTYPFGQVLLRNGVVAAVTVASDPSFVGPAGITLGMPEDQARRFLRT